MSKISMADMDEKIRALELKMDSVQGLYISSKCV